MAQSHLFFVRRRDRSYPFRHDVIDPVVACDAYATYESLIHGGTRRMIPADAEFCHISAADPLPQWKDGPVPLIRRLHAHNATAIEAHLLSLDKDDRHQRFFRQMTDAQIRNYVASIDWTCTLILGAIRADRIVGIAEALFDRARGSGHAEIAVSVDLALRGQGLGSHLVGRAVAYAEPVNALVIKFWFLQENRPIQRIVRGLGGSVHMEELVGVIRTDGSSGRSWQSCSGWT